MSNKKSNGETSNMIVIKNARTIGTTKTRDVFIKDGLIEGFDLGLEADPNTQTTIDASKLLLSVAFIDPHAHLREPGQEIKEDLESGLSAAARGGYGTVVCMPNTNPVIDDPAIVSGLIRRAEQIGQARLLPSAALTRGQQGKQLADAAALKAAGAIMLTDDGRTNEDANVLRRGLEYAHALGLVVSVHAEDASLRGDGVMNEGASSERLGLPGNPATAEAARIARDLEICATTGARLHIQHLSTARGLQLVREAKARGVNVTCEVGPHHLTLTDTMLETERFFCNPILKVAPPLRTQSDCDALLAGILDGTVDCLGSDHAPHTKAEKEKDFLEAPFGIANIEESFALLYTRFVKTGKLKLERLIELLTSGPARVLGMAEPKLEVGAPADLVLFDPDFSRAVDYQFHPPATKASFNSPWMGEVLHAWPQITIVRGQIVHSQIVHQSS
jgi:dihydroorotase